MRATIRIDDELYRAAKERAAQTGRTVGHVVADAIRRSLAAPPNRSENCLPPLPTYGGSGVLAGITIGRNSALGDDMEAGEPLDALR